MTRFILAHSQLTYFYVCQQRKIQCIIKYDPPENRTVSFH